MKWSSSYGAVTIGGRGFVKIIIWQMGGGAGAGVGRLTVGVVVGVGERDGS